MITNHNELFFFTKCNYLFVGLSCLNILFKDKCNTPQYGYCATWSTLGSIEILKVYLFLSTIIPSLSPIDIHNYFFPMIQYKNKSHQNINVFITFISHRYHWSHVSCVSAFKQNDTNEEIFFLESSLLLL